MALTDAQLLEQTRLAIDAITTGGADSYTLAGQQVTSLDLKWLWEQVTILETRGAGQTSRGMFSVSRMGRGN